MSESKEKREPKKNVKNRRTEAERIENQNKKKLRVTVIIIAAVLVAMFSVAVFINSNYIRRTFTAIKIGDMEFTATEFDYFYYVSIQEYSDTITQMYGDYASSMLPKSGKALQSQYYDETTGVTWASYYESMAIAKLTEMVPIYYDAKANGYEMSQEDYDYLQSTYDSVASTVAIYGFKNNDEYLQMLFGSSINEKIFKKMSEFEYYVTSYKTHIYDNFEYPEEELEEFYLNDASAFDTFTFRYIAVNAETISSSDYDEDEGYEAAKAEALEVVEELSKEFLDRIESEQDLIDIALEYAPDRYAKPAHTLHRFTGEGLDPVYSEWLLDETRKYGDTTMIQSGSGYFVLMFIERSDNNYNVVNMRRLTVTPKNLSLSDYDDEDAYNAAVAEERQNAFELAEFQLLALNDAGGTEEKLIELIATESDDSAPEGLYENINRYAMPDEVDAWLFDPARKPGDYELIETESNGFQLVYFIGTGMTYRHYIADTKMRENDYSDWLAGFTGASYTKKWAFSLTK